MEMWQVLRQLEKEMPFNEAKEIYEWYCQTYHVGCSSPVPATIMREVFGM